MRYILIPLLNLLCNTVQVLIIWPLVFLWTLDVKKANRETIVWPLFKGLRK